MMNIMYQYELDQVKELLNRYLTIIPNDNSEFRKHYNNVWPNHMVLVILKLMKIFNLVLMVLFLNQLMENQIIGWSQIRSQHIIPFVYMSSDTVLY